MINNLVKFLKLSGRERRLLLHAWILVWEIDLALRLLPYKNVERRVTRGCYLGKYLRPDQAQAEIQQMKRLVDIAARRHLYPMTCLRRALALKCLLGWQGIPTDLRFGVRLENGLLEAHAWLEYQGSPVGEPERVADRFSALEAIKVQG